MIQVGVARAKGNVYLPIDSAARVQREFGVSDRVQAIMDAAERRIRASGYGGFSFRDVAADVGVKSASVHYHFPTKGSLVAAVAHRYNDQVADAVARRIAGGAHVVQAWRDVFRAALADGARMCLCGSLGATSGDLAPEITVEVRRFFERGMESLTAGGLSTEQATRVLANLEGAILMASVHDDAAIFDAATAFLIDPTPEQGPA